MKRLILAAVALAVLTSVAAPAAPVARHAEAATAAADLIAFQSTRAGNLDIWVMHPNGGGMVDLAPNAARDLQPAWSPDGKQLAFISERDNPGGTGADIYVMNADGLGVRRVTFGSTPIDGPVWSPDGTKIAFAANIVGNWEIYIIGADGSGETNVTQDPGDDAHPAWSPDGTQIAFDSGRTGHRQIYTMTPAGTFLTPLTASTVYVSNPDWSPDGARIAYNAAGAVRAMLADGSKNYLVYDTLNPFLDVEPTWSPDGSEIAFSDDLADIGIVNPDGMGHAHITSGSTGDGAPSWQPPQCTVASVSSGDSFECAGGRRVRMLQIDAPDPGACGGDWAQAAMQYIFLKPGRTVGLKYDVATTDTDGRELAAPIWRGNDGMEYNLSIVMAYVGLAKAAVVGAVGQDRDTQRRNTLFLSWAQSSEAYAKAQQWNMWAPGKPFNGGC